MDFLLLLAQAQTQANSGGGGISDIFNFILLHGEKLGIISVLLLIIVGLICAIYYEVKHFSKQIEIKDNTIKEMTDTLLESTDVMTKLIATIDSNNKDVLNEIKLMANELKIHITMSIINGARNVLSGNSTTGKRKDAKDD